MYNSSFSMCVKLPKDTNQSVQKLVCQKIRKSLPWQQCVKAHPKYRDPFALLNNYPQQMENKTMKEFAKYSAVSYGKSQAKAGCQLN